VVLAVVVLVALGILGSSRRATLFIAAASAGCAAFLFATMAGFAMSNWWGLFGLHDHLDAAYAGLSLVVEGAGMAVFLAAVADSGIAGQLRRRTDASRQFRRQSSTPETATGDRPSNQVR